jgi:tetratricopeptide (TPR) repeat protein
VHQPVLGAYPAPLEGTPDLVLKNARVVSPGFVPASVILIQGERILAVGGPELEARVGPSTLVRDLKGASVVAGLRDAHGHLASLGRSLNERVCDLSGVTSVGDLRAHLSRWQEKRRLRPGEWVVGRGWDESKWPTRRTPDSTEPLDKLFPENPTILSDLGAALLGAGREGPAEEPLRRAVRARADFAPSRVNLGLLLLLRGETEEAARHLEEAVRLDPSSAAGWNSLGNARWRLGAYAAAIEAWRKAWAADPLRDEARRNLVRQQEIE